MAKASFHKNQRVYVKPVGTWAIVEKVLPQWVKGLDEPLKVHYDVGLGREFAANELMAETPAAQEDPSVTENWRLRRIRNRWRDAEDAVEHPYPGTFPVVTTDEHNWGGWRVPIAEYERDPERIEFQGRIIQSAPELLRLAAAFVKYAADNSEELSVDLIELAREGRRIIRRIHDQQAAAAPPVAA